MAKPDQIRRASQPLIGRDVTAALIGSSELVIKHDLELGDCVELPLSVITHSFGGYEVFVPPAVLQCPEHYEVLAHKFDIEHKVMRIALCPKKQRKPLNDPAPGKLS